MLRIEYHPTPKGVQHAYFNRTYKHCTPPECTRPIARQTTNMSLMLSEIAEQPSALARTISEERKKIARLGQTLKERSINLIVLVARGSSDNAALFGRYLLEITTGIPVSLSAPSVHTIYNANLKLDHALVVGVSQSGEGEDINRVLENARSSGAYTIGITNEP